MPRAILLTQDGGATLAQVTDLDEVQWPDAAVTVEVEYSTLNYKDALAITGRGPVVRTWPMVPGIDFAGRVKSSTDPRFAIGAPVVLNGWGVGETRWGGLAAMARAPAEYLIDLPPALTTKDAMAIGTAGYTAMLCVQALEKAGIGPDAGDVLVTGANGGVGGFAIALLARRGYRVVASTGRTEEAPHLLEVGAAEVIDRATLSNPGKPLQRERWAGAVDSVGGATLANVCAATRYGGLVAACGLAQSMDLPASVAPFILRGITLAGVDSVMAPLARRQSAWEALAREVDADTLRLLCPRVLSLEDAIDAAGALLDGRIRGRVLVDPSL
ncbi:acrylyl-CoA reductase (NADPH) [Ottowia thiooxydans]|uniref:Acrylyl-CoA reductase (NADPH) n=1 Tax=Ottowia thiooxydans TaxID=219182 RepID=A0ABV2QF09_9BURK